MLKKILISIAVLIVGFVSVSAYHLNSIGILRFPQYDTVPPKIPVLQHPAILVLNKTNGFIHKQGLPAADIMLSQLAEKNAWHVYTTDNAASHNSVDLARFDAVIWNNTSGDVLTEQQRAAFKAWLLGGGKWLGIHAAGGDPSYDWAWYRDVLIGAQFFGHTMSPQFQDADVLVTDAQQKLTAHLPGRWRILQEEWYAFDRNPRETGSTILLSLDEASYSTQELLARDPTMPGEHPIAWTHKVGKGEIIYSAIGHTPQTYDNGLYRKFIATAINHLLGR